MSIPKAAVIGCGVWGRNHVRLYKDLQNVELAAVVDANLQVAREIGTKYNVPYYSEIEKVIMDPSIQIISICTPTVTHTKIALEAISQGKHVLVEKPMTNTTEEARELIRSAKENNVKLTVGFVERFNSAVQEAYRRINNNQIGEIILAHTRRVSRSPGRIGDVGVIKDLAIHDIDIVNHLFKTKPETVSATAGKIRHAYEDYANINVSFGNAHAAFIETNWLTPRRVRTLTVTGTEGIIEVEYTTQQISIENSEEITQPILNYREPLLAELSSFINCVLENKEPEITGEDGLKALQICEAALESAETRRIITLE